jgi:hypothetical protein
VALLGAVLGRVVGGVGVPARLYGAEPGALGIEHGLLPRVVDPGAVGRAGVPPVPGMAWLQLRELARATRAW